MTREQSPITKQDIQKAEQRVGISHPILDVIKMHLPRLQELHEQCALIPDNQDQQAYIRANYGFLADAVVEAGDYSLEPLELVAIWSQVGEIFDTERPGDSYHKYAIAGIVATAYAIRELENPAFQNLPRYVLERDELPDEITSDLESMRHVRSRLDMVDGNIEDLDFYINGTRKPGVEIAFNLAKKADAGDLDAKKQLDELLARSKERSTPTLQSIHENFGNGTNFIHYSLYKLLGPDRTPTPDLVIEHLRTVYAGNPVFMGKLEDYATGYASVEFPEMRVETRSDELTIAEVEIEGKHGSHIASWKSGDWACDCDMFHGRDKFEGMRGECSHTMTLRILMAREGHEILLPSEQEPH